MTRVRVTIAGVVVAFTAAAALWIWQARIPPSPGMTFGTVPDFSLVERSGRTVTRAALAGKVSVVDFFYTRCTDACPLQSAHMARLQEKFTAAPDLLLVSITVDPEHDTRQVLTSYATSLRADPSRWLFLTGPREAIYRLAVDGFHLATIASVPAGAASPWSWLAPASAWAHEDEASPGIIQLTHASRFALVDRHGRIRNYFDGTDWDAVKRVATELEQVLAARD